MNNNPTDAAVNWHQALNSINPASLKTGQDAYAEICIRMANPTAAIKVLEPLVEEGKVNFERMTLIGLANAQKGNLERARTNLGVALRLGDLERPRKTKSSLHGRIFNRFGGLLYASIPIHPSIRKEIDSFFLE